MKPEERITDAQSMDQSANGAQSNRTWPYQAGVPERYFHNYARYLERGGRVRPHEDVRGFVAAEPGNGGDIARFYFFSLVLDQLMKEGIRGNLAELGVYKGATASLLAKIARALGTTVYLLDTFEGFSISDLKGVDAGQPVQFADTSLEGVRRLVGDENVRYIKGYFPDSASQLPNDASYCLVHIDCDLQAPMQSALEYFYPRLVPGGFLIVHDYSSLHWLGVEQAIDRFFANKPESPIPLTDGAGSAVIRKAKTPDRFGNWFVSGRAKVLSESWVSAANNGIGDLLGDGWSQPETWGVWGIGPAHEMYIYFSEIPDEAIRLEVDAYTVLTTNRPTQVVDVWAGNRILTQWTFELTNNRGVRGVEISSDILRECLSEASALPVLRVEFRPLDVAPAYQLDPSIEDNRQLGLGVWRVRMSCTSDRQDIGDRK